MSRPSDRYNLAQTLFWSGGILALALLVRVVNLYYLSLNDPAFYSPQIDSLWHHRWALSIIKGPFLGSEVYFRAPLYPYLLAGIYWLFGESITIAKLLQALGGGISCVIVYLLGRTAFGEREGRLAGIFAAFYGTLILYESELLIVWLAVLLNLLMVYLALKHHNDRGFRVWLLIGIVGGLSAITRPNVLLVFPLWFFWLLLRRGDGTSITFARRLISPIALTVGVLLCVVPVTIRNYIVGQEFVLIASQGGVNLHLSNNQQADGLTMIMPEVKLDYTLPWSDFVDTTRALAEAEVGYPLSHGEASSHYAAKAYAYMASHPLDFAALTGKRLYYFFSGFENSDQADIYRFKQNSLILNALIFDTYLYFPFGLIAPLALIGIALGWRRRGELAPLYLFLLGYIPTVVLFLVTARHRLPVVVLLLPFAALAIAQVIRFVGERNWKALVLTATPLIFLTILLNQTFFDLGYDSPGQFYYQRGMVLQRQGLYEEAVAEYRRALEAQTMPEAHNNIGYSEAQLGKFPEAYKEYHTAISLKPGYADPMINLASLFLSTNSLDSAEFYLNRAKAIAPNLPQIYINLAELEKQRNNIPAAERAYLEGLRIAPKNAPLNNNLGNLYLAMQRKNAALEQFELALQADPDYAIAAVNLANLYLERGRRHDAIELYRRAIKNDPALVQPYLNLAAVLIQEGETEAARDVLRDAPPNELVENLKRQLGMDQ